MPTVGSIIASRREGANTPLFSIRSYGVILSILRQSVRTQCPCVRPPVHLSVHLWVCACVRPYVYLSLSVCLSVCVHLKHSYRRRCRPPLSIIEMHKNEMIKRCIYDHPLKLTLRSFAMLFPANNERLRY